MGGAVNKYTRLFIDETRQYLEVIVRSLEVDGAAGDGLADSSRLAHSIKGMALFEEQASIADMAYALERGLAHVAEVASAADALRGHLVQGAAALRTMIDEVDLRGVPGVDSVDLVEKIVGCIENP